MSQTPYTVRDYEPGDEKQILELNRLVFGPMTEGYWRWRYLENPYGRAIIKLMFHEDKLVSQFAIQPFDFDLFGRRVRACFALDAMTHPAHRGKGLFSSLGQQGMNDALEAGYALGYAFLNPNSLPRFTEQLGWRSYGNTKELYMDLRATRPPAGGEVCFSDRATRGTERLWESLRSRLGVMGVPRDSKFLNWRFAPESGVRYQFVERLDERRELAGYAALKVYQNETGHVIDMLADGRETVEALLCAAMNKFRDDGLSQFSCWLPTRLAQDLRIPGLSERPNPRTFFCFKQLQQSAPEVYERESWFLTMADSDVY